MSFLRARIGSEAHGPRNVTLGPASCSCSSAAVPYQSTCSAWLVSLLVERACATSKIHSREEEKIVGGCRARVVAVWMGSPLETTTTMYCRTCICFELDTSVCIVVAHPPPFIHITQYCCSTPASSMCASLCSTACPRRRAMPCQLAVVHAATTAFRSAKTLNYC